MSLLELFVDVDNFCQDYAFFLPGQKIESADAIIL